MAKTSKYLEEVSGCRMYAILLEIFQAREINGHNYFSVDVKDK